MGGGSCENCNQGHGEGWGEDSGKAQELLRVWKVVPE